MPTWIYHITHIRNLPSILQTGGLLSLTRIQTQQLPYSDIAYKRIQDRRARTPVPCGPGGMLHDYIPFYFAPRSPMLYTINRGNVPGYTEGQIPILHLITTVEKIEDQSLSFVFTDGHAVIAYSTFFNSLNDLENIDWELMQSKLWKDSNQDGDRKRRRQAEFLVHNFLPWEHITAICVINENIQKQVQAIL